MSIQEKNVSVNLAAFQSAKFLGGLGSLSNEATVLLFRLMVLNEQLRVVRHGIGFELVRQGFVDTFGSLKPWVADHMASAIDVLLHESGANLLPQSSPTTISSIGHRKVKGLSKVSKRVNEAERIMRETSFCIDRHIIKIAYQRYHELNAQDILALAVLNSELVNLPEEFYFPISYDYRGRMYYRGGIISPQGSDFLKGVLRFNVAAPLGKHGRFAIVQALADAAGYKGTKKDAMCWAESGCDLLALSQGSVGYQAAGLAQELINLNKHVDLGFSEYEWLSGVICHQDATCSGLQIAAAITGHRPTAEATNCTKRSPAQGRRDIYGDVAEEIGNTDTEIGAWCIKFGRAIMKKPVMTLGYGAGRLTLKRCVEEFLKDPKNGGNRWRFDAASEKVFFDVIDHHCLASLSLKEQLHQFSARHEGEPIEFASHDGFEAIQEKECGEEINIGKFTMEFDMEWSEDDNILAISPNFVHMLDAAQMREAVCLLGGIPVACVHDSLGTRPCDYVNAGRAVRVAFVNIDARRIAKETLAKKGLVLRELGDYEAKECLESSYFWC